MTNSRKEVDLVNSLIQYVSDIKPYHSKLKNSSSEISFSDVVTASVTDYHALDIYHQNVWGSSDLGGESLVRISDGSEADGIFKLPADVFPRFSTITFTGADQIPVELDTTISYTIINSLDQYDGSYYIEYSITATVDKTIANQYGFGGNFTAVVVNKDGTSQTVMPSQNINVFSVTGLSFYFVPDALERTFIPGSYDLIQIANYALFKHNTILKIYWTDTGRFNIPFHQGARVRVNGADQTYLVDFTVDKSRNFIQFLNGKHPGEFDEIDVDLIKVDKLFISYVLPFDYNVDRSFDAAGYDVFPYDTPDIVDQSIPPSDYFDIVINNGYTVSSNYIRSSSGKASLQVLGIPGAANGETWRVTAIGPWSFTVQKIAPVVGAVEYAYFRKTFTNGKITFLIDRFWSDYYFTPDSGTYTISNLDDSDLLVKLSRTVEQTPTEPVQINQRSGSLFGKITKVGGQYFFKLDFTPEFGAYIEVRVEQNDQLNPWASSSITDKCVIKVLDYTSTQNITLQTSMRLLDMPIMRSADNSSGCYAVFKPIYNPGDTGPWPGGIALNSTDGVNYGVVIAGTVPGVFGYTTTTLNNWVNGNTWDNVNTVTVDVGQGVLSNATQADILADISKNAMLIGQEVIQFTTATLMSPGVYTLSGLLRGCRGTEWAAATHVADVSTAGDAVSFGGTGYGTAAYADLASSPFGSSGNTNPNATTSTISEPATLLDLTSLYRVPLNFSETGVTKYWKCVTSGALTTTIPPIVFSNTNIGLKPFSPVNLQKTSATTFTWDRRTRIPYTPPTTPPLGETSEAYDVDLLDANMTVISTVRVTTPSWDSGTPPAGSYLRVYQISDVIGRGYPSDLLVLSGSSMNLEGTSGSLMLETGGFIIQE